MEQRECHAVRTQGAVAVRQAVARAEDGDRVGRADAIGQGQLRREPLGPIAEVFERCCQELEHRQRRFTAGVIEMGLQRLRERGRPWRIELVDGEQRLCRDVLNDCEIAGD